MPFFKNKAQKIFVFATDANGAPKTGDAANIVAQYSIDGGTTTVTNDANPTELDAADAPGTYYFDMLAAETNGECILLFAKSTTTGVVLRPVLLYTKTNRLTGKAITDSTTNQIYIETALGANDFVNGSYMLFTSGTLLGQVRKILDYDNGSPCVNTDAFTSAPADQDTFVIINQ